MKAILKDLEETIREFAAAENESRPLPMPNKLPPC